VGPDRPSAGGVAQRYAAAIVAPSPAPISAASAATLFAAARAGIEEVLGVLEGSPVLAIDLDTYDQGLAHLAPPPWLPSVVIGVSTSEPTAAPAPTGVDVAITGGAASAEVPAGWVAVADVDAELDRLGRVGAATPDAAVTLAQVLRLGDRLGVHDALCVESLAYSTLQSGPAFAAWLASRPAPPEREVASGPGLVAERRDDVLRLTLNRPHVRNAVSAELRAALCEALAVACADPSVRTVELRGAGPSFCSGGDLDEFGTLPDPLTAHLARTSRSPARLLAAVAERTVAYVHGACAGAGIELAAFARRVVADPGAVFSLPELGLGLVPGAGGTVSIPRRVGRHRTMWLAMVGDALDAATARRWGLVDELAPVAPAALGQVTD
jgi:enoyl-CoA hydratase/carnithine racemase